MLQEVARDVIVDLLLQPPVPLAQIGSSLVQFAPESVKCALNSVYDTVRWLLAEEPNETVLDMEVMRALQQNFQASQKEPQSPPFTSLDVKTGTVQPPASESPQRRRRVHWSPTCESISVDGEKETSPIRPGVEMRNFAPESTFFNLSLFPLISRDY